MVVLLLDSQLSEQLEPITTTVVRSNPFHDDVYFMCNVRDILHARCAHLRPAKASFFYI